MENGPFSDVASGKISSKYVAVRLTGGDDITPEVRAFMTKYGVRGYPTMFVMNAAGDIVNAKIDRTVDGILEALAVGEKYEVEFAEVSKATDAKGRTRYAEMLTDRRKYDDAITLFKELEAKAPTLAVHEGLAKAYGASGDGDAEMALIEKMVGLYKDAEERPAWRVRVATKELKGIRSQAEAMEKFPAGVTKLEALLKAAQEEKDAGTEAAAHFELGNLLAHPLLKRAEDARKHLDTVIEKFGTTKYAPKAMMTIASGLARKQDFQGCIDQVKKVVEKYPESEEAKVAPRWIEWCEKRLGSK